MYWAHFKYKYGMMRLCVSKTGEMFTLTVVYKEVVWARLPSFFCLKLVLVESKLLDILNSFKSVILAWEPAVLFLSCVLLNIIKT